MGMKKKVDINLNSGDALKNDIIDLKLILENRKTRCFLFFVKSLMTFKKSFSEDSCNWFWCIYRDAVKIIKKPDFQK